MDHTTQSRFLQGDKIVSIDGETLGKLQAVDGNTLHVDKGWLFQKHYEVPVAAVERRDDSEHVIFLNVTRDEALNSDWTQRDEQFVEEPIEPPFSLDEVVESAEREAEGHLPPDHGFIEKEHPLQGQ